MNINDSQVIKHQRLSVTYRDLQSINHSCASAPPAINLSKSLKRQSKSQPSQPLSSVVAANTSDFHRILIYVTMDKCGKFALLLTWNSKISLFNIHISEYHPIYLRHFTREELAGELEPIVELNEGCGVRIVSVRFRGPRGIVVRATDHYIKCELGSGGSLLKQQQDGSLLFKLKYSSVTDGGKRQFDILLKPIHDE